MRKEVQDIVDQVVNRELDMVEVAASDHKMMTLEGPIEGSEKIAEILVTVLKAHPQTEVVGIVSRPYRHKGELSITHDTVVWKIRGFETSFLIRGRPRSPNGL